MSEVKKTLSILKARWPEVMFIFGLNALFMLSTRLLIAPLDKLTPLALYVYCGLLLFIVIEPIFYFGFLRTVYLQGQKRQSPIILLRTGAHFFWRMVCLSLLYGILFLVLNGLCSQLINRFFAPGSVSLFQMAMTRQLLFTAINLALMKLVLFIPALVIALDCGVVKSFGMLKHCKLSQAKELVGLFCCNQALTLFFGILKFSETSPASVIDNNTIFVPYFVVLFFVNLIMITTAVRFIASLDIKYIEPSKPLDFGDLREYSERDMR